MPSHCGQIDIGIVVIVVVHGGCCRIRFPTLWIYLHLQLLVRIIQARFVKIHGCEEEEEQGWWCCCGGRDEMRVVVVQ